MNRLLIPSIFLHLCVGLAWSEVLTLGSQLLYSRPAVLLNTGETSLELAPHATTRPGAEIRYRKFGLSFSTTFNNESSASSPFFTSGLSDVRALYHGDAWGFEGYHRYVRGFYGFDRYGNEISHPDMRLRSTSATVFKAVGEDSRVYRLSEGLHTTGMVADLITMAGFSQNLLRDDKAYDPLNWYADPRLDELRNLSVYIASAGGGLSISTNAGGFYFDPAMFVAFGLQHRQWDGESETTFNLVGFNLRMRTGFRTRWFDVGGGFEHDAQAILDGGESVQFNALVAKAQAQVFF